MSIRPVLIFLFFFFMTGLLKLQAQEEKYIGLFVYNFTKYFDWPEVAKTGNFRIQVLGHQSVADELARITSGKKIGAQNILVENVKTVAEINKCQMVFIGHWHSKYLPEILSTLDNYPTLIITEMEGMLDNGSAINFIIRDGTIKFELKTSNVTSHQLKADQRIRELAYRVVE